MEPMTFASGIAGLVGLIANFRQEHARERDLDHRRFIEYLEYHRHEELRNQIAQNHHLAAELDALLREDHDVIIQKLESLDRMVAEIASRVSGIGPVVHVLRPQAELSEQAMGILRAFVAAKTNRIQWVRTSDRGVVLEFPDRRDIPLSIREPQFLEDDLRRLAELGLMVLKYQRSDGEIFSITRNAVRLIEMESKQ